MSNLVSVSFSFHMADQLRELYSSHGERTIPGQVHPVGTRSDHVGCHSVISIVIVINVDQILCWDIPVILKTFTRIHLTDVKVTSIW